MIDFAIFPHFTLFLFISLLFLSVFLVAPSLCISAQSNPVLPMFVNNDIRKEMYKGADANVDAQFKKLYIYHMENVSILFADIKVSSALYQLLT